MLRVDGWSLKTFLTTVYYSIGRYKLYNFNDSRLWVTMSFKFYIIRFKDRIELEPGPIYINF
jgi:hypothetical protein